MTTIKSCPFCDHDNVEIEEISISEFAVDCPECRAIGPIAGDIMSAIAQWNGALMRTPEFVSVTPAGGGDISPAVADRATSLASNSGEAAAVVEPPKLDDVPAEAGSDEIDLAHPIDFEDDTDPNAFPHSRKRRLICSASSDGQVTIHRFGDTGIVLTADEAREVYLFIVDTARIWENN